MRDGSDGAALLAVVHYYCPEQMKLDGEWRMLPLNRPEREQCAFNMQGKPKELVWSPCISWRTTTYLEMPRNQVSLHRM